MDLLIEKKLKLRIHVNLQILALKNLPLKKCETRFLIQVVKGKGNQKKKNYPFREMKPHVFARQEALHVPIVLKRESNQISLLLNVCAVEKNVL